MPNVVTERAFELPPLELLVAFESAARHLSFTRAGDEIAPTQSAISRRILALEDRLGVPLLRRLHRALALTDDGAELTQRGRGARPARPVTRELRHSERARTVVVTTTPGFAGLADSRLDGFVAAHPCRRPHLGQQRARQPRARRRRRRRPLSPSEERRRRRRLFGETVSPVCSPRLLRSPHPPLKRPATSPRTRCCGWSPTAGPVAGLGPLAACVRPRRAAPAGVLILFLRPVDIGGDRRAGRRPRPGAADQSHLKSRKLIAPFSDAVVSPRCYFMVVSAAAAAKPEVRDFTAWLQATARAPGSARQRDRARS